MRVKLLAVAMVAVLPVACGSYSPTAPEVGLESSEAGFVSAQGRQLPPAPSVPCSAKSIELRLIRATTVAATYRDGLGNVITAGCAAPTWTVTPTGRMSPSSSGFEAKLTAATGTYIVVASGYDVWSSIGVSVR